MRKDIIVTALLSFCLTATLFMIATTRSQEYDPWADLNGDGKIDILDVVGLTDPESVTLSIYSYIYGPLYVEECFAVQSWVIRSADAIGAVTIPVPSEMFAFYINFADGTAAEAQVAYYLTYA
jgi:hypothetical protein